MRLWCGIFVILKTYKIRNHYIVRFVIHLQDLELVFKCTNRWIDRRRSFTSCLDEFSILNFKLAAMFVLRYLIYNEIWLVWFSFIFIIRKATPNRQIVKMYSMWIMTLKEMMPILLDKNCSLFNKRGMFMKQLLLVAQVSTFRNK